MSSSSRPVSVSEVMTRRLRIAEPSQPLQVIWQMLAEERCHHIPIVENGCPVGIISARDLVRFARRQGRENAAAGFDGSETAAEIMSTDLETIHVDESVEIAIDRIGRGEFHALLVVNDDEDLAGIVTNHDLLQYLIG
ncbi:MAG: CBS domain-containing protein [Deltaproteobacteria bacterium]|nr:CBS domain-containing protein [Deltaproteobacteria bacterium]